MKKLLVLLLSLTLCLGLTSSLGCSKTPETLQEDNFVVGSITENGLGLKMLTSETVVTETDKYLEKTLQVTVNGSIANAKPIDLEWYVTWYNSAATEDIDDYLKIETSEENTVCAVRLYQPLNDVAVIVVQCKNNGISASCLVEYCPKAHSTDFVINGDYAVSKYDTLDGLPALELIPGQVFECYVGSYDFFGNEIGVSKTLNVDDDFSCGSINMTSMGLPGTETEHSLSEFVNPTNIYVTPYVLWSFNEETCILRIEAVTALEDLKIETVSPTMYDGFYSVESTLIPYFEIHLNDYEIVGNEPLQLSVKVRVVRSVHLSLNNSNITFE
ncbi:MAG: hypothetical protein IKJ14_01030 [Clostridia bacterium]|nr:hypothetical protein [Clostridia bacterium]